MHVSKPKTRDPSLWEYDNDPFFGSLDPRCCRESLLRDRPTQLRVRNTNSAAERRRRIVAKWISCNTRRRFFGRRVAKAFLPADRNTYDNNTPRFGYASMTHSRAPGAAARQVDCVRICSCRPRVTRRRSVRVRRRVFFFFVKRLRGKYHGFTVLIRWLHAVIGFDVSARIAYGFHAIKKKKKRTNCNKTLSFSRARIS